MQVHGDYLGHYGSKLSVSAISLSRTTGCAYVLLGDVLRHGVFADVQVHSDLDVRPTLGGQVQDA